VLQSPYFAARPETRRPARRARRGHHRRGVTADGVGVIAPVVGGDAAAKGSQVTWGDARASTTRRALEEFAGGPAATRPARALPYEKVAMPRPRMDKRPSVCSVASIGTRYVYHAQMEPLSAPRR